MSSIMIKTAIQSSILAGFSNLLAQFISAQNSNTNFTISWAPVLHFILYTALTAPPNFIMQSNLERTFPSKKRRPAKVTEKPTLAVETPISEPTLSKSNTFLKVFLDQTVVAALNVLAFLIVFSLFKGESTKQAVQSAGDGFWDMMMASWKLWPWVSLLNFAIIKSVQGRALVGGLAGIVWNVWLSMVEGKK